MRVVSRTATARMISYAAKVHDVLPQETARADSASVPRTENFQRSSLVCEEMSPGDQALERSNIGEGLGTFTKGARQLVVHEALDMMEALGSKES